MSLEISREMETQLAEEAKRQGVSVETLLERLLGERSANGIGVGQHTPELPVWHLGGAGALHRQDIYDDAG